MVNSVVLILHLRSLPGNLMVFCFYLVLDVVRYREEDVVRDQWEDVEVVCLVVLDHLDLEWEGTATIRSILYSVWCCFSAVLCMATNHPIPGCVAC